MGTAASAADFFDNGAAAGAGSALLPEDFKVVGVVAILATGVHEMLEGSATNSN